MKDDHTEYEEQAYKKHFPDTTPLTEEEAKKDFKIHSVMGQDGVEHLYEMGYKIVKA